MDTTQNTPGPTFNPVTAAEEAARAELAPEILAALRHDSTISVVPQHERFEVVIDGILVHNQREPVSSEALAAEVARLKAQHERAELVAAVRRLADFIELHPELPLPRVLTYQSAARITGDDVLTVAARLRKLGYRYSVKESYGDRVGIQVPLGADVTFDIDAKREDVCTPRIDGRNVIWDLPAGLEQDDDWPSAA